MAKKDVDRYYDELGKEYSELLDSLRDMEEAASNNLVSPEKLDEMQKLVDVVKNNYMRISYIMYLLNLPNRKSKKKKIMPNNKFKDKDTLVGI